MSTEVKSILKFIAVGLLVGALYEFVVSPAIKKNLKPKQVKEDSE